MKETLKTKIMIKNISSIKEKIIHQLLVQKFLRCENVIKLYKLLFGVVLYYKAILQ